MTERRFLTAPFPLYGLPPDWPGKRFLGGGGWSSRGPHALSLVHGAIVGGTGPILDVETALPSQPGGGGVLRIIAERLWRDSSSRVDDVVQEVKNRHHGRPLRGLESPPTQSRADVIVDADLVPLEVLASGSRWVARGQVGGYLITLEGQDFPLKNVELVRVADLSPYVRGTREFEGT